MKRSPLVMVVLTTAILAIGCAGPGPRGGDASVSARPTAPKRVTAAINSAPATFTSNNIMTGSTSYPGGAELASLVNAGLTHADEGGTLHPQLAEAVPLIENGLWKVTADGKMETTWRIRENAKWDDGTPLTADDVLFTAALLQDKDLPIAGGRDWTQVTSVTSSDPRTVTVGWKSIYIRANWLLQEVRPKHILEPIYQADKMSVLSNPYWNEKHVGAGPFKLREFVAGSHVFLLASDTYVLGRPKLDELIVKFIPDLGTIVANILAGEIDLTIGRNVSVQQGMELKQQWGKGDIDIGYSNWIALWPQFLNPNPDVMLKLDFRRAVLHSINRQELVDTLLSGASPVAHVFVAPTEAAYKDIEPQIVKYDYDPRRAAQMIEGLGYTRGGDGLFRDAAGGTINLEVRTSGGDDTHEAGTISVADYLRKSGIDAFPFLIPQAQRSDLAYNQNFPGLRFWRQGNDLYQLNRLHSSESPTAANNYRGSNNNRYMNPAFDTLIERYMSTVSDRERVPVLGQIVRHVTENLTLLDLWYNTETIVVADKLKNVRNKKGGNGDPTFNAQDWDLV